MLFFQWNFHFIGLMCVGCRSCELVNWIINKAHMTGRVAGATKLHLQWRLAEFKLCDSNWCSKRLPEGIEKQPCEGFNLFASPEKASTTIDPPRQTISFPTRVLGGRPRCSLTFKCLQKGDEMNSNGKWQPDREKCPQIAVSTRLFMKTNNKNAEAIPGTRGEENQ